MVKPAPLNPATGGFETRLRDQLPTTVFRPLPAAALEEPRGRIQGVRGLYLAPQTTQQVALILRNCSAGRVGVVTRGGGTGLVGGQVLPKGPAPVILSLSRMNKLRDLRAQENLLVAEAGMILENIHTAAAGAGRLFPLSLAAQGSCQIGGNLATNAGGVNVLRYGTARALCLGLEAVLADGQIFHGLKGLRKDNMGYDLRDLLIGSEGTLGVITAATLRLYPMPEATGAALMVVRDPAAALELLALAQARGGEMISGFELISGQGLAFLRETMPDLRQPFASPPDWFVLIDLGTSAGLSPELLLEDIFEKAAARGLVSDGVIAQSQAQRAAFWRLRESIPEGNRRIGAIASHDIALPLAAIPAFIHDMGHKIAAKGPFRINCFGHLGDGNLHYNIFPEAGQERKIYDHLRDELQDMVYETVMALGGSISAEHGIGRLKAADLARFADPAKLAAMHAIKTAFDPKGILNPGAVLLPAT